MRALALAALLAGCGGAQAPSAAPLAGTGPDPAVVRACLDCHASVGAAWRFASSHSTLLDCAGCHTELSPTPGPGHQARPACARCHSEAAHPSAAACTACHAPHGSGNAFFVPASITLPAGGTAAIHFTVPAGASADGLVRQGVAGEQAGTGLCEVCHQATRHYNQSGTAAAHDAGWCARCHDHQRGFASPAR